MAGHAITDKPSRSCHTRISLIYSSLWHIITWFAASVDYIYLNDTLDVDMNSVVTNLLRSIRTAPTTSRITPTPNTAPITMVGLFWICGSAVKNHRERNLYQLKYAKYKS